MIPLIMTVPEACYQHKLFSTESGVQTVQPSNRKHPMVSCAPTRQGKTHSFPLNFLTTNTQESFFSFKPWQACSSFRDKPPMSKDAFPGNLGPQTQKYTGYCSKMEQTPACDILGVRQHKATGIVHEDPQHLHRDDWHLSKM